MSSPGMPSPQMQPPQGGTGAVSSPRPMQGNAQQALTLIHTALEALQKSLVGLPMGSELHTTVLGCVTKLSKNMNNSGGDKAAQIQALAQMGRGMQQNPQADIMARMGQGQPQAPAMPGGNQPPASPGM